jgi:hypothetical protein
MLSQELRNNAADFCEEGQIVLKDNNAGFTGCRQSDRSATSNHLEPFGDKKISARSSSFAEAYEAFNENLQGLFAL